MPKKRVTGVSGGFATVSGGVQWEYVQSDEDIARRVIVFLEDRRLLTASIDREDYDETRSSADEIRKFLTLEIMNTQAGGGLEDSLQTIRYACKSFIDAAGSNSFGFRQNHEFYRSCLRALRDAVGRQLGLIADKYGIRLAPHVQEIVPQIR